MLDSWISRWNDEGFQRDLTTMAAHGVTSPDLAWFLLPIIEELDLVAMTTFSGRRISLINPNPHDIAAEDICHHLALENRFNGATEEPYSVAQHSVWCWQVLMEMAPVAPPVEDQFTMVMHDAPEAFLKDFPRGLKRVFKPIYKLLEGNMWAAMRSKWPALLPGKTPQMDMIDDLSAYTELRDLFHVPRVFSDHPAHRDRIVPLPWYDAEVLMALRIRNLQERMR